MLSAYACASDSIQCEFHSNWIGSHKNLRHEIMGLCSANAYPQTSAQPHCFVDWTVYSKLSCRSFTRIHPRIRTNHREYNHNHFLYGYFYHPLRTESSYRQHSHYMYIFCVVSIYRSSNFKNWSQVSVKILKKSSDLEFSGSQNN